MGYERKSTAAPSPDFGTPGPQMTTAATEFAVRQIAKHLPDIADREVFARAIYALREAKHQIDELVASNRVGDQADDALGYAAAAITDEIEDSLRVAMDEIAEAEATALAPYHYACDLNRISVSGR